MEAPLKTGAGAQREARLPSEKPPPTGTGARTRSGAGAQPALGRGFTEDVGLRRALGWGQESQEWGKWEVSPRVGTAAQAAG